MDNESESSYRIVCVIGSAPGTKHHDVMRRIVSLIVPITHADPVTEPKGIVIVDDPWSEATDDPIGDLRLFADKLVQERTIPLHNFRVDMPDTSVVGLLDKEPTHQSWKGKGNRKMRVK